MPIVSTLTTLAALALAQAAAPTPRAAAPSQAPCIRSGCNGELCIPRAEAGDVDSICVALPPGEAACYKAAVCAPTGDKRGCGWADKKALERCLEKVRGSKKRG